MEKAYHFIQIFQSQTRLDSVYSHRSLPNASRVLSLLKKLSQIGPGLVFLGWRDRVLEVIADRVDLQAERLVEKLWRGARHV